MDILDIILNEDVYSRFFG